MRWPKVGQNRLFINYLAQDDVQEFNYKVAISILCLYLAWKVISVNWSVLKNFSSIHYHPYEFLAHPFIISRIEFIPYIALIAITLYAVRKVPLYGFIGAQIIIYLSTLLQVFDKSGNTQAFFIGSYILLLFVVFGNPENEVYRSEALKYSILLLGSLYFLSGLTKIIYGPLWEWVNPENLLRYSQMWKHLYGVSPLYSIPKNPLLSSLGALTVIAIEISLLPLLILRKSINLAVTALIAFHVATYLFLGPNFLDMIILLSLFLNWKHIAKIVGIKDTLYRSKLFTKIPRE